MEDRSGFGDPKSALVEAEVRFVVRGSNGVVERRIRLAAA
jgi:hypothetical protein